MSSPAETVAKIDQLVSHVWMVRTFLKHSEEAEEDDELREVFRQLYDFMHALGSTTCQSDPAKYLKMAKKKLRRLKSATELYLEIQPQMSTHTNFKMAAVSLQTAVLQIVTLVEDANRKPPADAAG